MKPFFFRLFILFICIFGSLTAVAYDVEVDGMYYNLDRENHTAMLTCFAKFGTANGEVYQGNIIVPEVITVGEEKYTVTAVDARTFNACKNLTSVKFPSTVTAFDKDVFNGCTGLVSCHMPPKVKVLPFYTFLNCTALADVTLPEELEEIQASAFYGCKSLRQIKLPAKIRLIGETVFTQSAISNLTLPDSLREIGRKAFFQCSELTEVVLPDSLTLVGMEAFLNCSKLRKLVTGQATKRLDTQSFDECPLLSDVYFMGPTVVKGGSGTFDYRNLPKFHVPNSLVEQYATKSAWKGSSIFIPLQCVTPDVYCENGTLQFYSDTNLSHCSTEETIHYDITALDESSGDTTDGNLSLTAAYKVKAVSTAPGVEPSDTATVTISWVSCLGNFYKDNETPTGVNPDSSTAVTVRAQYGILTVDGLPDGLPVSLYSVDGRQLATATSIAGRAFFHHVPQQQTIIVRFGENNLKIWSE